MGNVKMREEFEAAFAKKTASMTPAGSTDEFEQFGGYEAVLLESMPDDRCGETYGNNVFASAWWAWQASREALVIDLPGVGPTPEPPEDEFDDSYLDVHHAAIRMRNRCYLAIEAAGLKVKP